MTKVCSFDGCGRKSARRGLCATHYRQDRKGLPLKPIKYKRPDTLTCTFEGCTKKHQFLGFCGGHAYQFRKWGRDKMRPLHQGRYYKADNPICSVRGCGKPAHSKGMCSMHISRVQRGQPLTDPVRDINRPIGSTMLNDKGYVLEKVAIREGARNWRLQHHIVAERKYGRALAPTETVHHKNGIKADNSPDNLELRNGHHGPGVSVEDQIAWVKEWLPIYGHLIPAEYWPSP